MIIIETLDESIISKVHFKTNTCLEFASAVQIAGKYEELLSLGREMNYIPTDREKEICEKMFLSVSKYMRQELDYFFSICSIENIIGEYIGDNSDMSSVEKLVNQIEYSNDIVFFNYFGGIFIDENEPTLHGNWCNTNESIAMMVSYIEALEIENIEKKSRILECFKNPQETKQRLTFIFKQLYEKFYKPMEVAIIEECDLALNQYNELLTTNPQKFFEKYFLGFYKPEDGQWNYKINIHISFFKQIAFWMINLHNNKSKVGWAILGIRSYEFYSKEEIKGKVGKFLKAISDKRRVTIIELLSQKPSYGYEIAAILNLTPATINYHMNFLLDAEIVNFEREDNKVYFIVNKNKIKELFKETEKMLLND